MDFNSILSIQGEKEFEAKALEVFSIQYRQNKVYRRFCSLLGRTEANVSSLQNIPFLPIDFFKSKTIISGEPSFEHVFTSSGTTGNTTSHHYIKDLSIYEKSFRTCFNEFYGPVSEYCILALLPSYLEREGSSLIYMMDDLIQLSQHAESGFYLDDTAKLVNTLIALEASNKNVLLIGVSFALLDLVEQNKLQLMNTIVMETGGMKGRRKELIRRELHKLLSKGFGVEKIHSEYGMTELLSQAYSKGDGLFECPPWMKIIIRDTEDPLSSGYVNKTGGINVIDLANLNSCAFIATQDLGKAYPDGRFEVLGRFDHSDIRGCNLMVL
ncbi:MAG: acyl transferase [Flavobacteriaceae bacterium]